MDPRPRSSPLSSRNGLAPSQFRHWISDHGMSFYVQPQTHSNVLCHRIKRLSLFKHPNLFKAAISCRLASWPHKCHHRSASSLPSLTPRPLVRDSPSISRVTSPASATPVETLCWIIQDSTGSRRMISHILPPLSKPRCNQTNVAAYLRHPRPRTAPLLFSASHGRP